LLSLQPNLDGRGGGGLIKIDEAKRIFADSTDRPVTAKSRSGERYLPGLIEDQSRNAQGRERFANHSGSFKLQSRRYEHAAARCDNRLKTRPETGIRPAMGLRLYPEMEKQLDEWIRFRPVDPLRLVVKPLRLSGPQQHRELVSHLCHSNHSALNCCAQI
jgi:hypothetical protein